MKTYKTVNGTSYDERTSEKVINVLENCRANKTRIRVYYGDTETGKNWNEEHDVTGYVGRSCGTVKIPLLIYNSRSFGGGGLLDHCIIKIKESSGGRVLYKNPKFKDPEIEIKPIDNAEYKFQTIVDGKLYGQHTSLKSAENLKRKLS